MARVLSRDRMQLDRTWLAGRIRAAVDLRRHHAGIGDDTTAYRLVNGEGDGLPGLTVDRYGDYLMVQLYCNGWRPHLKLITGVLQDLLAPAGIYEKARPQKTRELEAVSDSKRYGRLLAGTAAPANLEVLENGLTFLVSLENGLNTGLFLDQRRNRRDLMTRSRREAGAEPVCLYRCLLGGCRCRWGKPGDRRGCLARLYRVGQSQFRSQPAQPQTARIHRGGLPEGAGRSGSPEQNV